MGSHRAKPNKSRAKRSRLASLAKGRAKIRLKKLGRLGDVNAVADFKLKHQELLYPDVQLDFLDREADDNCERQSQENRFFYHVLQHEQPCSKTCILCCSIFPPSTSNDDLLDSAADVNLDFTRFCQLMESKLSNGSKKFNPDFIVEALTSNSEEDAMNAVITPKKPRLSVCDQCQPKVSQSVNLQREIEKKNKRVSDLKQELLNELGDLHDKVEGFCGELENIQEIVEASYKSCENYLKKNGVENDSESDDQDERELSILKEIVCFREGINNVVNDLEFREKCGYGEPFLFSWAPPESTKATILKQKQLKLKRSNTRRKQRLIVKTKQTEFESNQETDTTTVVKEEPEDEFCGQDETSNVRSMKSGSGSDDDDVHMDFKTDHDDEDEVAYEDLDLPIDIDPNYSEEEEDESYQVQVHDPLSDTSRPGEIENTKKQKTVDKNVAPCAKKAKISNLTQNREFYRCSFCPMIPPMSLTDFVQHLVFHNDNPAKCTVCGSHMPENDEEMIFHWKKFHGNAIVSEALKTHFTLVVASKAKLFACNLTCCVQWFSSVDERNDHEVKVHNSVILKPFSCDICKEGHYSTTDELKLHEAVAHPEKVKTASYSGSNDTPDATPKLCQLCGEVCGKPSDSLIHKICRHSDIFDVQFHCTICDKHFDTPNDHQNHIRTDHLPNLITNQEKIDEYKGKLPIKINQVSPVVLTRCYLCANFQNIKSESKLQTHLREKHYMKVTLQIKSNSSAPKLKVSPTPPKQPQRPLSALENCNRTFKCPTCPHLGEMPLDIFSLHITFHYRRPNKCTECCSYLSSDPGEIDNHWNDQHKNLASSSSSSSSKCVPAPKPDLSSENIWQCSIGNCSKSNEFFSTEEELNGHEELSHEGIVKNLACNGNGCSKRFSDAVNLRLHKALCHPEIINVSCYYCDETFPETSVEGIEFCNPSKFSIHLRASHGKQYSNECYYCGASFRELSTFVEHMTTNHNCDNKCLKCEICFRNFTCGQGSLGRYGLISHVMRYHKAKELTCDICGLQLREEMTLVNHKFQQHGVAEAGIKVWICEICGYKTTKKPLMRLHKETHLAPEDRPRPFSCDQCGKSFTNNNKLKRHLAIHENASSKPYKCEICGASFAVKNYLYIHNRLSHAGRYFPSTHKKRTRTTKNDGVANSTKSAQSESSQSQSQSTSNSKDSLNGNSQQVQ